MTRKINKTASLKEVAKHLGISRQACTMINSEEPGLLVVVPDPAYKTPRYDLSKSLVNYRLARTPRADRPIVPPGGYPTSLGAAGPQNEASAQATEGATESATAPMDAGLDLDRKMADTRKANALADLAELDLAKKRGELLPTDRVKNAVWLAGNALKESLLQLPVTLSTRLVGLDEAEIRQETDKIVLELLNTFQAALAKVGNPSNGVEKQEVSDGEPS